MNERTKINAGYNLWVRAKETIGVTFGGIVLFGVIGALTGLVDENPIEGAIRGAAVGTVGWLAFCVFFIPMHFLTPHQDDD